MQEEFQSNSLIHNYYALFIAGLRALKHEITFLFHAVMLFIYPVLFNFFYSEFFHLLCLEFVNPQYALFQCVNGLYKPSPNSNINTNHLIYFEFFGKMLAKSICDGMSMSLNCDTLSPSTYPINGVQ